MFSVLVVVFEIGPKDSAQMVFVNDNDVVQTFASNASMKSLNIRILPGTVVCRTQHPTAEWTGQQILNAFPWDTTPK
jgi:hypothetical protein